MYDIYMLYVCICMYMHDIYVYSIQMIPRDRLNL